MSNIIEQVKKARIELLEAYNTAYQSNEHNKAKFISNAINQLDALLHIDSITKKSE